MCELHCSTGLNNKPMYTDMLERLTRCTHILTPRIYICFCVIKSEVIHNYITQWCVRKKKY